MLMPRWLGALGVPLLLSACSLIAPKFEKPVVSVLGVELVGGNFLQQNFLLKLNIENPNKRALPVTSLHADLSVLGDPVASGVNSRSFIVPARGSAQFDMTITANMAVVLLKLAGRGDKRSDPIDYELTGEASIDLPFLRNVPFRQHGALSPGALGGRH
jgi:LEA14-like dessication related protein